MGAETVEEYRQLFKEFVETAKRPGALFGGPASLRMKEISAELREYQRTHPRFTLVCIKSHFAGQGTDWNEGDVHSTYFDRDEAESLMERLKKDGWNPDCWKLVEHPPEGA